MDRSFSHCGGRPGDRDRRRPAPPAAPGELVQAAAEALGPVDVLVSKAGLSRIQPLQDITAAQLDEMLAVNLRAPFLLAQAVVRPCGSGVGRILFIFSVAGFTGGIVGPHYAAPKAGPSATGWSCVPWSPFRSAARTSTG